MQAIYIPHLTLAPDKQRLLAVNQTLPGLETLTPVKGQLRIQHCGNFLDVAAKVEAIVTLSCDRCLQHYNSRVTVDTSEFIWLQEPEPEAPGVEREVALADLVETLSPQGHFHPDTWLYEQFCLALPQRQICDQNCPGIGFEPTVTPSVEAPILDGRWAALSALKQTLSDNN